MTTREPTDVEIRVAVTPEVKEALGQLAQERRSYVRTQAALILEDWAVRQKPAWRGLRRRRAKAP